MTAPPDNAHRSGRWYRSDKDESGWRPAPQTSASGLQPPTALSIFGSLHRYVAVFSLRTFPDVHSNTSYIHFLLPIAWEFLCTGRLYNGSHIMCVVQLLATAFLTGSSNTVHSVKIGGRSAPKHEADSASTRVELW